jgi:UDP-2-acetamido-3-amino-2,3-dideoxy-glucuronate N-acetyltransferase
VGNPSQQIGWVSKAGMRLQLDENGFAVCEQSNEQYQYSNGHLKCTKP